MQNQRRYSHQKSRNGYSIKIPESRQTQVEIGGSELTVSSSVVPHLFREG